MAITVKNSTALGDLCRLFGHEPKQVKSITLHSKATDVVTVDLTLYPDEDQIGGLVTLIEERFKLIPDE